MRRDRDIRVKLDYAKVSRRQAARARTYQTAWVGIPAGKDQPCTACGLPIFQGQRVQYHVDQRVVKHTVCPLPAAPEAPAELTREERIAARADDRAKRVQAAVTADKLAKTADELEAQKAEIRRLAKAAIEHPAPRIKAMRPQASNPEGRKALQPDPRAVPGRTQRRDNTDRRQPVWFQGFSRGVETCAGCATTIQPGRRRLGATHPTRPRVQLIACLACGPQPFEDLTG